MRKSNRRPARPTPAARLSLIERALIEKRWHDASVRAQIHAIMGEDGHQFVNAAGRMLWVVMEAAQRGEIDSELPEVRVIRGACNALYEQAEVADIDPARRASIAAGLEACTRLMEALSRRNLIDAACALEIRLRAGTVRWSDFEPMLESLAA